MTKITRRLFITLLFVALLSVAHVSATTVYCHNCTDCTNKIQSAELGDTVILTEDIIDHAGTCIDFGGADLITFDGGGHIIDGIDSYSYYGIYLPSYSCNDVVTNCTISDFRHGVYLFTSSHNEVSNITAFSNLGGGICILYSQENEIKDCLLEENKGEDFYFRPNIINDCDTTLINVTGSGGRQIGFYEGLANVSDMEFSALYICNSAGSTFDNITVSGSDTIHNNAIRIYFACDGTLSNVSSTNNMMGIGLMSANGWTIRDSDFSNSHHYNIFVDVGFRNIFENIVSNSSNQCGMYLYHAPENTMRGSMIGTNPIGIRLDTSPDTVIQDSWIVGNYVNGISGGHSEGTLIYNNYFDNTDNVGSYFDGTWNITPILGTNIIGGEWIGGNYWNDYNGEDTDCDGFGEIPYDTLCGIDYLPLVHECNPVFTGMFIRNYGQTLRVHDVFEFLPTCRNETGFDIECGEVLWCSSNTTVGTIDGANLTCLAVGTTNITAFWYDETDTILQPIIEAPECGDVDCDGVVTVNDVTDTYLHVVNPYYQLVSYWASDTDGDEYTTVNDVIEIYLHVVNPSHQLYCTEG